MNKIVMAIGIGPNSVEIPLLAFPNMAEAKEYFQKLGINTDNNLYDEINKKPQNETLINALFKNGRYYGGCGACDYINLEEIEFGKPIVEWDLD